MSKGKTALTLFLAALVVRTLLCSIFANEVIPGSDQMQEIMLGRNLACGDFYGVLDVYWAPFYPILIGAVSFFIDSPVIPAALVSIIAGSVIVTLTYLFVLQSYGEREALIAGAISLFFPHLTNSVVALGSENVFIALMLGVLIVAWKALLSESAILFLCAGALLGLAYLSRPEAIGYCAYLALAILVHKFWRGRKYFPDTQRQIAAMLLGFFLFATPYLLYLRAETGQWTISGKAKINTIVGELNEHPESIESTVPPSQAKMFVKYFFMNLVEFQKMLPALFPLLLWIFVGLGLFAAPWVNGRIEREVFLLLFVLATVIGYAAAVIQLRYFYVLLPILIAWLSHGLLVFVDWLRETFVGERQLTSAYFGQRALQALSIAAIFLYLLPLNFYMRSTEKSWQNVGYEERDAGLWLGQNATGDPYIFSASRRPVFYAGPGARQMPPASENVDAILWEIKEQGVDYVVTSERSLKRNNYLTGFDDILRNDPDFLLVYEQLPRKGYGISIFKRK